MASHTSTMVQLLWVATTAAQDTRRFPSEHVCRESLRALCSTDRDSSRRSFWNTYEFHEERIMIYIQVVSTSSREMACDNRHMTRGESA